MKTNSNRHHLWHFLCVVLLTFTSCKKTEEECMEYLGPFFQTGQATFVVFGGVVQTFQVKFDHLGSVPIEEYGILYAFDADSSGKDPDMTSNKVMFEAPAQIGVNEKIVQIGFPVGAHYLRYRAYTKLKDKVPIRYADPVKISL